MKRIKRILSLLLIGIMLISSLSVTITVYAETEGVCGDNLTWRFSPSSGVLTILGEGEMYSYRYQPTPPWQPYISNIKSIVLGSGITSIGDEAFDGCTSLTSVVFPSSLTKIGGYAFSWCTSLKSVIIPDNITNLEYGAFYHCTSLEKAVIGKGVTEIKFYTFADCTSLYDVQFSDSLEIIKDEAFYNCSSYENIVLPDHYVALEYNSFMDTAFYNNDDNWNSDGELYLDDYLIYINNSKQSRVIVKPGTKYIAGFAMIDLNNLMRVYYPKSVEKINGALFYLHDSGGTHVEYKYPHAFGYSGSDKYGGTYSTSPTEGSCGENVKFKFDDTGTILTIYGDGAMKYYDYNYHPYFSQYLGTPWEWVTVFIDELVIEGNITSLNSLPSVRKLTLGEQQTYLYSYPVNDSKLEEIVINENNPAYTSKDGVVYSKDMKSLVKYPCNKAGKHFEIPSQVTSIAKSAFSSLNDLKTLYIPETVTTLEESAVSTSSGITIQCKLNSPAHIYAKRNNIPCEIICDHSFTEYTDFPASCTEDSYRSAICDLGCGATDIIVNEGSATGHRFESYKYNNDASCTENGTATAVCENGCLAEETRIEEGTALGHMFTEYEVITEPDCIHNEVRKFFCDRCDSVNTVTVDNTAWGHTFTEYTEDNNADCIHDGTKTAVCTVCNASDSVVIENSATGHSFTDYTVISEPSCTEVGIKEALCDNGCGEKDIITEEAIGHSLGEWVTIEEPTYDVEGYKVQNCTLCSNVINTENIPVLVYEGFPDVHESAWYYEGVEYCCKHEYIMGTDKGTFDPDGILIREQFVTILARIEGIKPSEYTVSRFTDVKADAWYGPSVIWANEKGYVNGVAENKFGVGKDLSREELATILYRYAKSDSLYDDVLLGYIDSESISSWAKIPSNWAVAKGILSSTSKKNKMFSPKMAITRAQAAKIFMSYDMNVRA